MPPVANHTRPLPKGLSEAPSIAKNSARKALDDTPGAETKNNLPSEQTPARYGRTTEDSREPERFGSRSRSPPAPAGRAAPPCRPGH